MIYQSELVGAMSWDIKDRKKVCKGHNLLKTTRWFIVKVLKSTLWIDLRNQSSKLFVRVDDAGVNRRNSVSDGVVDVPLVLRQKACFVEGIWAKRNEWTKRNDERPNNVLALLSLTLNRNRVGNSAAGSAVGDRVTSLSLLFIGKLLNLVRRVCFSPRCRKKREKIKI